MKLLVWIFLLTCFLVVAASASDEDSAGEAEDRRRRGRRQKKKKQKKQKKQKQKPSWPYALNCNCGKENAPSTGRSTDDENRIVGGTELGPNQYPWLVGLSMDKRDDPITCTGTLLDSRWVLTAAHCVNKHVQDKLVWARIGEHKRGSAGSQVIRAKAIYIYPFYNTEDNLYDMALIWLSYHAVIWRSSGTIRPVCYPPNKGFKYDYSGFDETRVGGIIAGWGGTQKDGTKFPDAPHHADINIISNSECNRLFDLKGPTAPVIVDDEVCTLDTAGNKDTCSGDSGGPLMIKGGYRSKYFKSRFYIHGVHSFGGLPCADPGTPAIYARAASYTNWIKYVINQDSNYHNRRYYCKDDKSLLLP